jgi:TRAP transporter TAXI family solute receptor
MKKTVIVMVAALLVVQGAVFAGGGKDASGGDKAVTKSYLMATSTATGSYYSFGSVMSQVISTHTNINLTVTSTGGSIENARLLGSGENEFALIQTDVNHYALSGTELFAGKPIKNFSAISAIYPEMVQIVVTKASGIKSVTDMKNKKICVGAAGSGYEVAARQVLATYGMDYNDIDERFLAPAEAKNALQDGQIDAFFLCSGYPNANVTELSLTGKIEVVTIDPEHLAKMVATYPFYSPYTTPDDQYNLGHSITSVSVIAMFAVRNDIPEDEVYAITKAIYDNIDELRRLNSRANYVTLEGAFRGINGNVHPGAARFYKEKGLTVPANNL